MTTTTKATKNNVNNNNVNVISENAKTKNENAKTKKLSVNDIFSNLAKSGINLTLENSHRSVFKKELIENLTEAEAKVFRRKIRKMILSFAETLCNTPTDTKAKQQFNELYKQIYAVNDYSLQSICSDNMKEANKKILQKALDIAKK